jgi:hypothetical protein
MFDLPEDTILSHTSKGRLRLKVPSMKRNPAFFDQLQRKLKEIPGLTKVQVNPLSGSILILHTELPDEISAWMKSRNTLPSKGNPLLHPNNIHKKISVTFEEVNGRIRGFTKGELDVPTLSFVALLTVGIYQISRGNFTAPAWYTAFWYALNIFLKSKE